MGPKKRVEEEPPPQPHECLPPGFVVGGKVFWLGNQQQTAESSATDALRCGQEGSLVSVPDLTTFEKEDGTKGYLVEFVEASFEGLPDVQRVHIAALSSEPVPLEQLDQLSTGLRLPLKGLDVAQVWAAQEDFGRQASLLTTLLHLDRAFASSYQRSIVCDFQIFNLSHASAICLSSLQAAVFVAIMHRMLEMARSDADDSCNVSTCYREFEQLMLAHSGSRPPQIDIFRNSEARMLTDFASRTFFQHFLLYKYCVASDREIQITRCSVQLDRPLLPPDLNRGRIVAKVVEPERKVAAAGSATEEAATQEEVAAVEDEIELCVQAKLKEIESRLQAKLDERERAFKARLEEQTDAKKKGGKK
mmetsp:Transcript_8058/g.17513  ORF Transcript_8058/g.17513 Transcript_8058/m.17513 type:complete len:362 (+) Transcript_8058:35-1120(+)